MALSYPWIQHPAQSLIIEKPNFQPSGHFSASPPSGTSNMLRLMPYLVAMGVYSNQHSTDPHQHACCPLEKTGPFDTWYHWKQIDFKFESRYDRERAIINEEYMPKNVLPLGIAIHKDRIFVTFPKWKSGIPYTLTVLPRVPQKPSPLFVPYPHWIWHGKGDCAGLISVFRVATDDCDRLWVLDSGLIHISIEPKQLCPPKILLFDLNTDTLILSYELPKKFIKQDSLYSNIMVDTPDGDCDNVHAYIADVWRFGLVVFSLKRKKSWRITDHLFYPDPLAAAYKLHNLEFEWTDGIFSLALSPEDPSTKDKLLYFHPMSSFREFYVKTSIICNETGWSMSKHGFQVLGESRGKNGHASASGMDRNGILFYNLVSKDSIGCWDSRKPYKRANMGIVARNSTTIVFPNDLKIDQEPRQSIWILTNRLPYFLYKELDEDDYNFRIMSAYIDEAISGTICDPAVSNYDSYQQVDDGEDCY